LLLLGLGILGLFWTGQPRGGKTASLPASGRPAPAPGESSPPPTTHSSPTAPGVTSTSSNIGTPSPDQESKPLPLTDPRFLRGLYLTGYTAGDPVRFGQLLDFARSSGLNAMVIDVKDDDGRISFSVDIPLAEEIGAVSRKIRDPRTLIRTLEENGIYPIARIVVFCDPLLSRARPEWAVTVNGELWRDRRNLTWTSPFSREVWRYNVEVAKEAARAGFREIQFDYVRFPEKDIPGFTLDTSRKERTRR